MISVSCYVILYGYNKKKSVIIIIIIIIVIWSLSVRTWGAELISIATAGISGTCARFLLWYHSFALWQYRIGGLGNFSWCLSSGYAHLFGLTGLFFGVSTYSRIIQCGTLALLMNPVRLLTGTIPLRCDSIVLVALGFCSMTGLWVYTSLWLFWNMHLVLLYMKAGSCLWPFHRFCSI